MVTNTPTPDAPSETTTPPASTPATGTAPAGVSQERWDAILADLHGRGVTDTPTLVSAASVTWDDGSLGCPEPGKSYTQALVQGQKIVVKAGGTTYDYRFGKSDAPKLCTV